LSGKALIIFNFLIQQNKHSFFGHVQRGVLGCGSLWLGWVDVAKTLFIPRQKTGVK
jgi:hypothetical protein